jgi:hypothetical protein
MLIGTTSSGISYLIVNTSRSFPHSRLITGFVTRLTRRVPLGEQELLTLPEYLSSPKPYSEEEQTTQWPKEKVQKDKQRTTKHTYKTKNRVTRTVKLKSSFRKFYGRHHDLVDRYGISVSQMTTDMFHLS